MVCERAEMLASGCAVVRGFPTYSMKTASRESQVSRDPTLSVVTLEDRVLVRESRVDLFCAGPVCAS